VEIAHVENSTVKSLSVNLHSVFKFRHHMMSLLSTAQTERKGSVRSIQVENKVKFWDKGARQGKTARLTSLSSDELLGFKSSPR